MGRTTVALKPLYLAHRRRADDLLEHLCQLRGFDPEQLLPDYSTHLHDPNKLPDMDKARELMRRAVKEKWQVAVFGDYDADGTPAAALLSALLGELGLEHEVILPTRESGYGLRMSYIEEISTRCRLLITVDTGVSSVPEITRAKELGLGVIVLDHHLPGITLPPADALIDPYLKRSSYPFKELCGCALAFKFACALQADFPAVTAAFCKWQLDLVAIATVADMMPLIGENRVLVHYGLVVLRQQRRPGLRALVDIAGIRPETISAATLGFVIGPRLNASGRLGDNTPAFELLSTNSSMAADRLARVLETANAKRQALVETTLREASELLFVQNQPEDRIFLVQGDHWPAGVVGLVAGKLSQRFNRPVVVGTALEGEIRASARSIEKYPVIDGLSNNAKILKSYGGHALAAGLSAEAESWEALAAGLKSHAAATLTSDDLRPTFRADAVATSGDLDIKTVKKLERLEPFGLANKQPLVLVEDAIVEEVRFIGGEGRHLRVNISSPIGRVEGIGFDLAGRYKSAPITEGAFLGYLDNNYWNGRERLQLKLIDFQPQGVEINLID
jgi:single-stranded-DNA-specific exonuclease